MTKVNKKVYETPMVEVMNARIEKGFAGSTPNGGNMGPDADLDAVDPDNNIDFD